MVISSDEGAGSMERNLLDELLTRLLAPFGLVRRPFHTEQSARDKRNEFRKENRLLEQALADLVGENFSAKTLKESLERNDNADSSSSLYSVPSRVGQLESWDCGLACIMMVLRWMAVPEEGVGVASTTGAMSESEALQYRTLRDAINTQSIWTADLVRQIDALVRKSNNNDNNRNTSYLFCSKVFQVEEEDKDEVYYQDAFGSDKQRVTTIFTELQTDLSSNLFCAPQGIPLDLVLNAACHFNCIALVLIDYAILCSRQATDVAPYVGHYVILCGVSRDPTHLAMAQALEQADTTTTTTTKNAGGGLVAGEVPQNGYCVVLCDPGQHCQQALSFVTPERFERSRCAKGTDEDIVFFAKALNKAE